MGGSQTRPSPFSELTQHSPTLEGSASEQRRPWPPVWDLLQLCCPKSATYQGKASPWGRSGGDPPSEAAG